MAEQQQDNAPAPAAQPVYTIKPRDRHWEVCDAVGTQVCLTVYKRGAVEVVRRLAA